MKKSVNVWKATAIGMILALGATINLDAQEIRLFGVKGGLNLSYLRVDRADDNNILPGFHIGLWTEMRVTEVLGFQPELLYSVRGTRSVFGEDILGFSIIEGDMKLGLHYIDIPLYIKLNLSEDFNFHLGPYIGILMFTNADTNTEILEFINIDNIDAIDRDHFNIADFGISGGIGFNMDPLIFGINYNLGLRQVAADDGALELLLGDAASNSMQLYIGVSF